MEEIQFVGDSHGVVIESRVLGDIIRASDEFHPRLVSACLYGYYGADGTVAVITGIAPLSSDSVAGPVECLRGVDGLPEFFQRLWDRPERRYYVSEFHSRPNGDTYPSEIDNETMRAIASQTCPEAVLVIVGGSPEHRTVGVNVYSRNGSEVRLGEKSVSGR